MEELQIVDIYLASALLTYGVPFIAVKNDEKGNYFFVFKDSMSTKNIITLYEKQRQFLKDKLEETKFVNGKKIMEAKTKFGGIKHAFKESTRKIKGAPQKSNGVWKG